MMNDCVLAMKAYQAVIYGDWEGMKMYYTEENFHSLIFPITVNRDNPIHMAAYSKSKQPLKHLLDLVVKANDPHITEEAVVSQNAFGNTFLHKAALAGNYEGAKLFVKTTTELMGWAKTRELLEMTNNKGETALFKAAWYGHTKVMKFLASQPGQMTPDKKLGKIHRSRNTTDGKSGDSILHLTIKGEHFGTALALLNMDVTLAEDVTSSLKLMANLPHAFKSGHKMGFWERILYFCLPVFDNNTEDDIDNITDDHVQTSDETQKRPTDLDIREDQKDDVEIFIDDDDDDQKASKTITFWRFLFREKPTMGTLWKLKRKHKFAFKLAKFLIERDKSWEQSFHEESSSYFRVNEEQEGEPQASTQGESKHPHEKEIALFTATRRGIIEIVSETLRVHAQAVEHCSHNRQNILHVAVLHRQKKIFDLVKQMKVPMTNLVEGIDKNGFTILHCAADMSRLLEGTGPGPAYQLQDELNWFFLVEKLLPAQYANHYNNQKTARQLFREQHKKQHEAAQKWIKDTAQSCSAVAVLVATVVFAAAYTVPGGSNEHGLPNLLDSPVFLFFTIMDVISLTESFTAVVMFLSILSSPSELDDFYKSLPRKLTFGFTMLFLSVTTTMLAFTATILLVIRSKPRLWTSTLVYTAAFLPVSILAMTQFPLYVSFMDTLMNISKAIGKTLPLNGIRRLFSAYCLFRKKKSDFHSH